MKRIISSFATYLSLILYTNQALVGIQIFLQTQILINILYKFICFGHIKVLFIDTEMVYDIK